MIYTQYHLTKVNDKNTNAFIANVSKEWSNGRFESNVKISVFEKRLKNFWSLNLIACVSQ